MTAELSRIRSVRRGGCSEGDGRRRSRHVDAVVFTQSVHVEPDLVGLLDLCNHVAKAFAVGDDLPADGLGWSLGEAGES